MKQNQQPSDENDLAKQIMKRGEDRSKNFGSFLDKLMEKYGGEEDDEEVDIRDLGKRTQKNKKKSVGKEKKETPIKAGRVSKRNK
jgi:DnaJ homolog subfamily C member 9